MPMQRQQLDVPLTTGLSEKDDPKNVQSSGALTMQNCVMLKRGAVCKRFGHSALALLAGIDGAIAAGAYRGAPWLACAMPSTLSGGISGGPALATWSDHAGAWNVVDRLPDAVALDRLGLAASNSYQGIYDIDVAAADGFVVTAYTADPNSTGTRQLFYSVVDASTLSVVTQGLVDSTISFVPYAPKLTALGTTILLTIVQSGTGNIAVRTLSVSAPSSGWASLSAIATGGAASVGSGVYDVAAIDDDAAHRFLVAFESSSGGCKTLVCTLGSGSVNTVAAVTFGGTHAATDLMAIALSGDDGGVLWCAYSGTLSSSTVTCVGGLLDDGPYDLVTPGTAYTWSLSAGQSIGRTEIRYVPSTQRAQLWLSPSLSGSDDGQNMANAFVASVLVGNDSGALTVLSAAPLITYGVVLYSRSFIPSSSSYASGAAYLVVLLPSVDQGTLYLCCADEFGYSGATNPHPLRWVTTFDPRLTQLLVNLMPNIGGTYGGMTAPHVADEFDLDLPGEVWAVPSLSSTSTSHETAYLQFVQFASTDVYSRGDLYNMQALAGGVPAAFDGSELVELGFAHYPQCASATVTSGGSLGVGTYSYIATYEWYDAIGNIHRSATSPAATVTTTAGKQSVSLVWTTLALTARRATSLAGTSVAKALPTLVLYRTTVGGTIYYQVATAQVVQDAATITLTDAATDVEIESKELLYTTGGELDNYCPPSARICIVHANRWWLAGCPDPTALWPSKEITTGEAPGFNEDQNITCSGAIRALASMDDKLIIGVQRDATYGLEYMTGQGPTDAGTMSDWTPPQAIPSDVGPVDQRSVCVGPFGVLFRATVGGPNGSGGIYLLTRDLQIQYLSSTVEDLLAAYPVVTSIVLHPNAGRVYVTCVANDYAPASGGVRLVWDYTNGNVWSADTIADPDTSSTSAGARCACVAIAADLGPTYHWISASGRVYRETRGVGANSYTDAGAWIPMLYSSALLAPSKSGFARFWGTWVGATALDPADLTVVLSYDGVPPISYGAYYAEAWTWTAEQVATFDRAPAADVRVTPGNQKARAIQITLYDSAPSGGPSATTGEGFSINALAIDIGVKPGGYQNLPPGQRG